MLFTDFIKILPKIKKETLVGAKAHIKMAPLGKKTIQLQIDCQKNNPKTSAVLALFYPKNNQTHLVFILRNSYKGIHSAQIGFPGGKVEPFDTTLETTALRETEEEIGVLAKDVTIIRSFSKLYIPPSNFLVYPFMGIAEKTPHFIADPTEVQKIIEIPLQQFLNNQTSTSVVVTNSYFKKVKVPAFKIKDTIIWGATAMLLSELRYLISKAN